MTSTVRAKLESHPSRKIDSRRSILGSTREDKTGHSLAKCRRFVTCVRYIKSKVEMYVANGNYCSWGNSLFEEIRSFKSEGTEKNTKIN